MTLKITLKQHRDICLCRTFVPIDESVCVCPECISFIDISDLASELFDKSTLEEN